MSMFEDLNANEKFALEQIMHGICVLIGELKYYSYSNEDIMIALIKSVNDCCYIDKNELIKLIQNEL